VADTLARMEQACALDARQPLLSYAHAMGCSEKTLARICTAAAGVGAKAFIASRQFDVAS